MVYNPYEREWESVKLNDNQLIKFINGNFVKESKPFENITSKEKTFNKDRLAEAEGIYILMKNSKMSKKQADEK